MTHPQDFSEYLAPRLRVGTTLRVYHICTRPSPTPAIFAPAAGQEEESTTCESHFLGITKSHGDEGEVLVLGIEVLTFQTSRLTTIFVSKADSTGFLTRETNDEPRQSVAQVVITAFLEFLVDSKRVDRSRLVLSLFARAQNQYLFPGSIENSSKHVLDDRQLIKWWCRVLDALVKDTSVLQTSDQSNTAQTKAYIVVPGCDKAETKAFFPHSKRSDLHSDLKWENRYPVELLVADTTASVHSLIPRLPDDPKARFCTDLDGEKAEPEGMWRSVRSLDQFWEMMSYRQECSAGRLVGFIWVVFADKPESLPDHSSSYHTDSLAQTFKLENEAASDTATKEPLDVHQKAAVAIPVEVTTASSNALDAHDPLPSPTQAASNGDNTTTKQELVNGTLSTPATAADNTGIVINADAYEDLSAFLLDDLDFAGLEAAQRSTAGWLEKLKDLSGIRTLGCEVAGRLTAASANPTQSTDVTAVNVLTAVRKKRKATSTDIPTAPTEIANTAPKVNTLQAQLVRKKLKPE